MSRFCKTLETKYQIPTVGGAAANVMNYAVGYNVSNVTGMPIRFVGFPFPVAGQPQEVHRRYIRGNDMLSGKPMMPTIIEGLTKSLTDEEKYAGSGTNCIKSVKSKKEEKHNRDYSIGVTLPPLSMIVYKPTISRAKTVKTKKDVKTRTTK